MEPVTALIITFNEIANIERTLDKLVWANEIVIVDSGSTDGTLDIARRYPNLRVVHRPFDNFADQCNYGLSLIATPWVLSIDADYELSNDLIEEIGRLEPVSSISGYRAGFVYRIDGHPLRGALYPPRVVLYRPNRGRYRNEGHGHKLQLDGTVLPLAGKIFHDDRKPLVRWFNSQLRYAMVEADYLLSAPQGALKVIDRIRKLTWAAPPIVFIYTLFIKQCLLDGKAGWTYALQRVLFEIVLALELLDRRLRSGMN